MEILLYANENKAQTPIEAQRESSIKMQVR